MSRYRANLELLQNRFPAVARSIEAAAPEKDLEVLAARDGSPVPHVRSDSRLYPLHSTVAPVGEGARTAAVAGTAGYLVVWGLGFGYHLRGLIDEGRRTILLVVDDASRLRRLLEEFDFRRILEYPRLQLLLAPSPVELSRMIRDSYLPGLDGGLAFIPLSQLARRQSARNAELRAAVDAALKAVRADFSVQSHFGLRWTRNILINLSSAETDEDYSRDFHERLARRGGETIVTGAGPSLIDNLDEIRRDAATRFLIATDTSLPVLLAGNILPDTVVSIDSQYYTLLHAESPAGRRIPWWVTLAAPVPLVRQLGCCRFFASSNPLELEVARRLGLPRLETGGGNVLQTALSLARHLGARSIRLYGADYANPGGLPYPPESYVDRWYDSRCSRIAPRLSGLIRFTLDGRPEGSGGAYDPAYPNLRLGAYAERLRSYLEEYPVPIDSRGYRPFITGAPRHPATDDRASISANRSAEETLSELLDTVLGGTEAESIPLLYPLIAYLRARSSISEPSTALLIEEARELFQDFIRRSRLQA